MKWTIPILMFLTLTMSFSKGLIWLEYKANKEFISRNLCINKYKPLQNCQGKCQAVKKLAETEKENPSAPSTKFKLNPDQTALLPDAKDLQPFVNKNKKNKNIPPISSSYPSPVFSIFHPPA